MTEILQTSKIKVSDKYTKNYNKFLEFCKQQNISPEKFLFKIHSDMNISSREFGYFGPKTIKYLKKNYEFFSEKNSVNNNTVEKINNLKVYNYVSGKLSGRFQFEILSNVSELKNNKKGLETLYQNLHSTLKYGLNIINDKFPNFSESISRRLLTTIFLTWVQRAGATVVHEVAHVNKAKKYGYDWQLGYGFHDNNGKTGVSVYNLFISQLFHKGRAFAFGDKNPTAGESIDIFGAGITTNLDIAKTGLEDALYDFDGKFDIVDSTSYIFNKGYLFSYLLMAKQAGDDPIEVLNGINKQYGTHYTLDDIKKYSVLSFFSGGMMSALKNGYGFIFNNKSNTEIIGFDTPFGKVFMPEFDTWLNKNNISFSINNYIKIKNGKLKFLKLGYEKNIMGEVGQEITIGGKYQISEKVDVNGDMTFGDKGKYLKGQINYKKTDDFTVYVKGGFGIGNTNIRGRDANGGNYGGVGFSYKF